MKMNPNLDNKKNDILQLKDCNNVIYYLNMSSRIKNSGDIIRILLIKSENLLTVDEQNFLLMKKKKVFIMLIMDFERKLKININDINNTISLILNFLFDMKDNYENKRFEAFYHINRLPLYKFLKHYNYTPFFTALENAVNTKFDQNGWGYFLNRFEIITKNGGYYEIITKELDKRESEPYLI